jgi:hypothetical protein
VVVMMVVMMVVIMVGMIAVMIVVGVGEDGIGYDVATQCWCFYFYKW